jgi:hypothetical protein
VRDRVENEVVFSFRVMVEPKFKEIIKTKLKYKLGTLLSQDKHAIDPTVENSLEKYVAWQPEKEYWIMVKTSLTNSLTFSKT